MAFFIDDLLLAPFKGFGFIFRTLQRVAEEQYTDDAPLKEQLLELQVRLDSGEISEEEYVEAEAAILRELREIQRRKIEMAGGDPDQFGKPLEGTVAEGSGASITWEPPPTDKG